MGEYFAQTVQSGALLLAIPLAAIAGIEVKVSGATSPE